MTYNVQQEHNSQSIFVSSSANSNLGLGNRYVTEDVLLTSILSALRRPQWQVHAPAVRNLGKLGERAALEPLVATLRQDTVAAVKVAWPCPGRASRVYTGEPLIAASDVLRMM